MAISQPPLLELGLHLWTRHAPALEVDTILLGSRARNGEASAFTCKSKLVSLFYYELHCYRIKLQMRARTLPMEDTGMKLLYGLKVVLILQGVLFNKSGA